MNKWKIDIKQRNLLVNSEVTKEFPWLLKLLNTNITLSLHQVPEVKQNEFINVVPFIVKQAREEWKGNDELLNPFEDLGSKRKKCSLCNTPNKYIYYIKNRLNGIKLNVGSECVKEYVVVEADILGKTLSQLKKDAQKTRRMADVNSYFNNIDKIIESWDRKLDTYEVLIPNKIRIPYLDLHNILKEKYNGYLNLKYTEKSFKEIGTMYDQYHNYIDLMITYEKDNINKKYVVTKNIVRWLERNGNLTLIEQLKETGYLDSESINQIYEMTFMKKIENNIRELLEQLPLNFEKVDYENEQFIVRLKMYNGSVSLSLPFEKFMRRFGSILLTHESKAVLDIKNLLKSSSIYTNHSKEFIVDYVNDKHHYFGSRISFSLHEESFNNNEIDVINIEMNQVLIHKLSLFLREFKSYIITDIDAGHIRKDERYLMSLEGKRYTVKELNDIRDAGKNMNNRLYKDDEEPWKYIV